MTTKKIFMTVDGETIEATGKELEEILNHREAVAAQKAEEDSAKAALETKKQEVLAKLGLTADEVAALLA
jgi:hypothetical protein